ncbi:MAG: hypothetical protein WAW37_08285 [Syntrophobacteraceae bacterium]
MGKATRCSACGKEERLVGRGMCSACYHRARRERLRAGGEVGGEGFRVSVDFSPMAFLLEELKKKAGAELRDVGPQILWELNKSMGAGVCGV